MSRVSRDLSLRFGGYGDYSAPDGVVFPVRGCEDAPAVGKVVWLVGTTVCFTLDVPFCKPVVVCPLASDSFEEGCRLYSVQSCQRGDLNGLHNLSSSLVVLHPFPASWSPYEVEPRILVIVTSQQLVLLNLSVFFYLAFECSFPSSAS
jgi:hypothetical protein